MNRASDYPVHLNHASDFRFTCPPGRTQMLPDPLCEQIGEHLNTRIFLSAYHSAPAIGIFTVSVIIRDYRLPAARRLLKCSTSKATMQASAPANSMNQ